MSTMEISLVLIVGHIFFFFFQEIKKYANIVALDRRLVDPIDPNGSFLLSKTNVVSTAQALNMTVFYVSLSNEFNSFAFDYRSDPILQIYSIIQEYKMNGFLTDHPKTLYNFLNSTSTFSSCILLVAHILDLYIISYLILYVGLRGYSNQRDSLNHTISCTSAERYELRFDIIIRLFCRELLLPTIGRKNCEYVNESIPVVSCHTDARCELNCSESSFGCS